MRPAFRLSDRRVLIFGATGGIGRSLLDFLHREGCELVLVGRTQSSSKALECSLSPVGPIHTFLACDLTIEAEVSEFAHRCGRLDGVVFAAGVTLVRPLRSVMPIDAKKVMDVNLNGPIEATRALLRAGCINDGASLVYVSSLAGTTGSPAHTIYSASKGGLNAFVRSLAVEIAKRGIRVNTVSPGLACTSMATTMEAAIGAEKVDRYASQYPLGLGTPDDVAGVIAFLLTEEAKWITGQDLHVDGGISIC